MSLRTKLFLIFGGFIALVVFAQWWLFRSLTGDISTGFGQVAMSVGQDVARVMMVEHIVGEEAEDILADKGEISVSSSSSSYTFNRSGEVEEHHEEHSPEIIWVTHDEPLKETIRTDRQVKKFKSKDGKTKVVERTTIVGADGQSTIEGRLEIHSDEDFKIIHLEHGKALVRSVTPEVHETVIVNPSDYGGLGFRKKFFINPVAETERPTLTETRPGPMEIRLDQPMDASFLILEKDGEARHIQLPRARLDTAMSTFSKSMLGGSMLILLIGLAGGALIAHRVSRPLNQLATAAQQVGEGSLGTTAPEPRGGYPEVGQAIQAFNSMSVQLKSLDEQNRMNQNRKHLSELGEVARGLAHTIRNPLNTLGLSLEQLAAMSSNPDQSKGLVDSSRKQIRRIDQWIRSFLALASEGKGQVESLNVGGMVQDVALEAIQDNPGRARLETDVAQDLPIIRGVAPELRAVIQALVVNAVEASPKGETVHISVTPMEKAIHIKITDRGSGLPDEVRKKLFTPHVTTKTYGSGMGLFLAHRIATTRYNGSLHLQDVPEGGTRAVLQLPQGNQYDEHSHSRR